MDHSLTYAFLIGASEFPRDPEIHGIPNVAANIDLLRNYLIDPAIVGIPPENIVISLNESKTSIERALRKIVVATKNRDYTLLVYYSGHGMLSDTEYKLYLTTTETSRADLEIDGIPIDDFRKYIRRSSAGRKIVILDCCHSGAVIESMGDLTSTIQAGIRGFEGTYVMTSAAPDEPSLFPLEDPASPTYFTGMMLQVLRDGIPNDQEYLSLRDIYTAIEVDFTERRDPPLPKPQQSNYLAGDQLYFSKNKQFMLVREDERAWQSIKDRSDIWTFHEFREKFPLSQYFDQATDKILFLDEEIGWKSALDQNTLTAYIIYKRKYPEGRHITEVKDKIEFLRLGGISKPDPVTTEDKIPGADLPKPDQSTIIQEPAIVQKSKDATPHRDKRTSPDTEKSAPRVVAGKQIFFAKYGVALGIIFIILISVIIITNSTRNDPASQYSSNVDSSRFSPDSPKLLQGGLTADTTKKVQTVTVKNIDSSAVGSTVRSEVEKLNLKGNGYYNQSKYTTAAKYYNKVLALDPNDSNALFSRAQCYNRLDRYNEALAELQKCFSNGTISPDLYQERGIAYYSTGEYKKSVDDYTTALISVNSAGRSNLLYDRALSYHQLGEFTNECQDLQNAKDLGDKDAQTMIDRDCSKK